MYRSTGVLFIYCFIILLLLIPFYVVRLCFLGGCSLPIVVDRLISIMHCGWGMRRMFSSFFLPNPFCFLGVLCVVYF